MRTELERRAVRADEGCYEAGRAAALSGVPRSTVYFWARTGVVAPTVSPVREKLWSYADLIALRIVSWLRHPKHALADRLPASPMQQVRDALAELDRRGLDIWSAEPGKGSPLVVDRAARIHIREGDGVADLSGQLRMSGDDLLEVLGPYAVIAGAQGPDLIAPRPHLRIVPARVAGEPHIAGSRLTTLSLAALAGRGMTTTYIAELYEMEAGVIEEALDLERQLTASVFAA